MLLSACKKEDTENLSGTKWIYYNSHMGLSAIKSVIHFTTDKNMRHTITQGTESELLIGRYEYNPPKIIFTANEKTFIGTIDGNKLTFDVKGRHLDHIKK